jgi:hypothetical protein
MGEKPETRQKQLRQSGWNSLRLMVKIRRSGYFDFYGTRDAQRLSISSYHMDSEARVWFQEFNATQCVSRWDEFV